ncbi:hypothetical protein ACTFIZ_002347 [Dictyostelium cf. discoideum]
MYKINNIYLLLCLSFIYKIVLSDLNVNIIDFKNQYAYRDNKCYFEKSLVVSHPDSVYGIEWYTVEPKNISLFVRLQFLYQINYTTIYSTEFFGINGTGELSFYFNALTGNSSNLTLVRSQNFFLRCLPLKEFRFEPISEYFYNFNDLKYSVYINIIGIDDNFDLPRLITENPLNFWMKISNDFGKFKLTMWGVPGNFTPLLFFYDESKLFKYNITSPYKDNISYKDSIIDRKSPEDYQMIHRFDYPQYWIKLKPKERYPYLFLTNSKFPSPKLVSSDNDGSYNYFTDLRPIRPQYYTSLLLQNYTNVFNISDNYKYNSFGIYLNGGKFAESLESNRNKLIHVECTGYNVSNIVEIPYYWGSSVSFLLFPFGYGGGNNSEFKFDITVFTTTNLSNLWIYFTIETYLYFLKGYSVEGPTFIVESSDSFSSDSNTILFRLNYSTPNGLSKIDLYLVRWPDVVDEETQSFQTIKYTSKDFSIISGDLQNGVLEFLYHNQASGDLIFKIICYDVNLKSETLFFSNRYNTFPSKNDFNPQSISNITFLFNDVNLTNDFGYNIMYLETYNVKLPFEPCLQIKPQWDNITIYGEWVNSRYEFKFFMPPNIIPGAFEYSLNSPSLNYILNTELPDEFQLNVISDRIDLMGPIVTTMHKDPSFGVAFIDNENYNISWTFTIKDYNGFNNGYVVFIGSIDNILYNVSIISPIEFSKEFTYQINITLNNNTCTSQTYSISEMVLYDRYGLNSTFFVKKGPDYNLDYTPKINPLYSIENKSLFSIETECPIGRSFIQPEIKSFDFEPKSINVGSLNRDVTFTYGISIGSGIKEYPIIYLTSTNLQTLKCIDVITTQINSTFNQYKCTLTIPYGFGLPQDIFVNLYGLIGFGAYFGFSSIKLRDKGYPFLIETSFTVLDSQSPGLITGTSPVSSEGGSFYIYGRFPPDADFTVEFSQGYSLTPSAKSGLIIKVDGVKPSNDPYTISIKNGYSKSNIFTITPIKIKYFSKCKGTPVCGGPTHGTCNDLSGCICNWEWEGEDCNSKVINKPQPSKCKGTPICGGTNHGTCDDLLGCICNSPWVGVDCNSKVIIVPQPEFNITSPTIVLNETTSSDNSETNIEALINIIAIREIDYNNKVLHIFTFDKWIYNSNNSKLSTYSSNIINKNGLTTPISVSIEYFENERTIEFAGQQFNMKPSSIKYTIYIDQYPFSTKLNQLQLIISATAKINSDSNSNSCSNKEFDNTTSESSDYVKLSLSSKSLYGRFIRRALVDSVPLSISNELLDKSLGAISDSHTSQSFIGINIPIYNKNVIIDPDFSLLLNSNPSTTNYNSICSQKPSSGLSKAKLAGIIISCCAVAIAITVATVVTIKKKRNLKKEIKVFNNKLVAMK